MAQYSGKAFPATLPIKGHLRIVTFPTSIPLGGGSTSAAPTNLYPGVFLNLLFASNAVELAKHYLHKAWSPSLGKFVFWEDNKVNLYPTEVVPFADVAELSNKSVEYAER